VIKDGVLKNFLMSRIAHPKISANRMAMAETSPGGCHGTPRELDRHLDKTVPEAEMRAEAD